MVQEGPYQWLRRPIYTAFFWIGICKPHNLDNYWGYGVLMVLVAISVVIIAGPKDLSHKYKRIVHENNLA